MDADAQPRRVDTAFEEEFPQASRHATEAVINLLLAADRTLRAFDRLLRRFGLSEPATNVLAVLEGAGEPLEPRTIANRLLVTSGSMTSLLNTLERRGLVRRLPHPHDGRRALVQLTIEGADAINEILPHVHALEREVVADLSVAECQRLVEITGRIQRRMSGLDALSLPDPPARRTDAARRDPGPTSPAS